MLVAGAEVDLDAAGAQQVLVVEGNAREVSKEGYTV